MSGYTPGPWSRNIPPAKKYATVWSGRNTHVAYVATCGLSDEEVEGNINLIAAAPELLEALIAIDEETKDYPSKRPYSTDSWLPAHLRQMMQTAIAKAKGEQEKP